MHKNSILNLALTKVITDVAGLVEDTTISTPLIAGSFQHIADRGFLDGTPASEISYQIETGEDGKILKLEYKNAAFLSEVVNDEKTESFTNFQIWFYEKNNLIEIHYGPSFIGNNSLFSENDPISISFMENYNYLEDEWDAHWYLSGNPDDPELKKVLADDADTTKVFLSSYPKNGTVYQFLDGEVGIYDKENTLPVEVCFNSKEDIIEVLSQNDSNYEMQYAIYDIMGRPVMEGFLSQNDYINISTLNPNWYILSLRNKNLAFIKRFLKY